MSQSFALSSVTFFKGVCSLLLQPSVPHSAPIQGASVCLRVDGVDLASCLHRSSPGLDPGTEGKRIGYKTLPFLLHERLRLSV